MSGINYVTWVFFLTLSEEEWVECITPVVFFPLYLSISKLYFWSWEKSMKHTTEGLEFEITSDIWDQNLELRFGKSLVEEKNND